MSRRYYNFLTGLVSDNPLAAAATALTSAELADVPLVNSPDYIVVTLDPDNTNGNGSELAYITSHSANAATATILRGQEGTTALDHPSGTRWVAAAVATDYERLDAIEADDWVTSARIADDAVLAQHIAAVNPGDISAGTAAIDISGEAATAARWTSARNLTLTGDVTGTAAITGAANVSLTATVTNNSHVHSGANITSGTIDNARLPATISGKTLIEADAIQAEQLVFTGNTSAIVGEPTFGTLSIVNNNSTRIFMSGNGLSITSSVDEFDVSAARTDFPAGSFASPSVTFGDIDTGFVGGAGVFSISLNGGTTVYNFTTGSVRPIGTDADLGVGVINETWNNVYYEGTLNDVSDERLKTPETDALGLSFLRRLSPYAGRYTHRDEPSRLFEFVNAQDVRAALTAEGRDPADSALWSEGPDGLQTIGVDVFIPVLINALIELDARLA